MTATRWAWAEIRLAAIAQNVRTLKARTSPTTRFMAVVKADGYGHGALRVAQTALQAGATHLGVATVAEALSLREAGIAAPLHVLSEPPVEACPALIAHRIVPTVTTREFASALSQAAVSRSATAGFHLKVDTGMSRIGVLAEDAWEFATEFALLPGVVLEGVFTHLATADVAGDWDVARQLQRFDACIRRMREEGVDPGVVHAANSAGAILYPESHYDMVRCGIAIYGLHPGADTRGEIELAPAMSVKARAVLVKRLAIGDGVSYGLTWRAASPTSVATLPLGYADGVHRALSNRLEVLGGGQRLTQVGRVCMDQLMVDCGRETTLRRGDEFVLVGAQANESIVLDDLAEAAGTINYELACSFGQRLERIYV